MVEDDDNRPLVEMEPHERARVFRKIGRSLNAEILADPEPSHLVCVRRAATRQLVYAMLDHGDGYGLRHAVEFVQECIAERLVRIGELVIEEGDVLT